MRSNLLLSVPTKIVTDLCSVLLADGFDGYKAVEEPILEAIIDTKFTYVATCQIYGNQKRDNDPRATDILNLLVR